MPDAALDASYLAYSLELPDKALSPYPAVSVIKSPYSAADSLPDRTLR